MATSLYGSRSGINAVMPLHIESMVLDCIFCHRSRLVNYMAVVFSMSSVLVVVVVFLRRYCTSRTHTQTNLIFCIQVNACHSMWSNVSTHFCAYLFAYFTHWACIKCIHCSCSALVLDSELIKWTKMYKFAYFMTLEMFIPGPGINIYNMQIDWNKWRPYGVRSWFNGSCERMHRTKRLLVRERNSNEIEARTFKKLELDFVWKVFRVTTL